MTNCAYVVKARVYYEEKLAEENEFYLVYGETYADAAAQVEEYCGMALVNMTIYELESGPVELTEAQAHKLVYPYSDSKL